MIAYSPRKPLQSGIAPSLRGSLRLPTTRITGLADLKLGFLPRSTEQSAPDSRAYLPFNPRESLSFSDNDFIDVEPEDTVAALKYSQFLENVQENYQYQVAGVPLSVIPRPRITLNRVKSLSQRSLSGSVHVDSTPQRYSSKSRRQPPSPVLEESGHQPVLPRASSSTSRSTSEGASTLVEIHFPHPDWHSSELKDSQSCYTSGSSSNYTDIKKSAKAPVPDPNTIPPSPPASQIATPATLTPSLAFSSVSVRRPFSEGLRRLKTLGKGKPFPHKSRAARSPPSKNEAEVLQTYQSPALPELSFDSTPLSLLFHEDLLARDLTGPIVEVHPATPLESLNVNRQVEPDQPLGPKFPLVKYEFVDPRDLTASPTGTAAYSLDYSATSTPLIVPSPSWLSRNIKDIELASKAIRPRLRIAPPSPAPLPILPRSLYPFLPHPPSPTTHLSVEVNQDFALPAEAPRSARSSAALFTKTQRFSYLSVKSTSSRPSSINRLSILSYHVPASRSVQSFITCASATFPDDRDPQLADVSEEPSEQSRFFLLLHPPSPKDEPQGLIPISAQPSLSPLDLFDLSNPFSRIPENSVSPSVVEEPLASSAAQPYAIFRPSRQAFADNDQFPLPNYLKEIAKAILRNPDEISAMPYGKPADTVDFGDEVDYSGYEWFKDPPPRPAPPSPPPATEPYVPQPGVIEQNELFEFALRSAPSVLLARFKQYGQLGVLGWCSEFSEMIDALKTLGIEGNMFVSTREQALRTCSDILKLEMKIEMQIIVMYLSSQVARLRRFLDGDHAYDDYPKPSFPADPNVNIGPQ